MCRKTILSLCAVLPLAVLLAVSPGAAPEKVVLRTARGRFLRAAEDGVLRGESFLPGDKEAFALVARGKEQIALKGPGGRWLVPDARDGRTPRLGAPPRKRATTKPFSLCRAGRIDSRSAPHGSGARLVFDPADARPPREDARRPGSARNGGNLPRPRFADHPADGVAGDAPCPGRGGVDRQGVRQDADAQDGEIRRSARPHAERPERKKRHKVVSVTEEFRIQAQLDGEADVRIPAMLYLASRDEGGPGVILLAVDARLPVRGHVQYKLPDVASASTGYRAEVQLSAVAEVGVERAGGDVKFSPPAVLDLHVSFSRLDLSNDLLKAVRRQIKEVVNHELRHNAERIRQQANHALQKAMSSRDVRIPLLGYLNLL